VQGEQFAERVKLVHDARQVEADHSAALAAQQAVGEEQDRLVGAQRRLGGPVQAHHLVGVRGALRLGDRRTLVELEGLGQGALLARFDSNTSFHNNKAHRS